MALAPAPASPPATPVTVSYMYAVREWQLSLDVEPYPREIFVALGDGEFASTGFWTALDGTRLAKSLMTIPDRSQAIQVRILTKEGKTLGPYTFDFNRDNEIVAMFKRGLEENKREWLSFREYPARRWLVYFSYLTPKRCGIREARYSIDSAALDQVVPLPPCNMADPYAAAAGNHNEYRDLKRKPGEVQIKLFYADGTESEVVTLRP